MKLSIIIPTLNEASHIESLLAQLSDENVELIVVDGGSDDQTVQRASVHAKLVYSSTGRAVQMNTGAAAANGDWLWFLHADTQLSQPLNAYVDEITQSSSVWGRFTVRLNDARFIFRVIERLMNARSCFTSVATGDQGLFVDRRLFDELGGFPELPLMEDVALSKRLRKVMPVNCSALSLITSARRWQQRGVLKTIVLMWWLRLAYVVGVSPARLRQWYR
ncbi:MAG: TIGR04283 family arsenosugar biosynthesis glycosyltransferase [Sedimenticolaceae bacterium]